jgi:16S rRNA (uracil1498-N3)-methyltransferase
MERYDFRTQRLFLEVPLQAGVEVTVDRAQANYLLNVLRLKSGNTILLFNGRDGEWLARIEMHGRKSCSLKAEYQTRPQHAPYDLVYCFAPLKKARLDYMVQKAVEMGAGVLQPVITHHTQTTRLAMDRMRANAIEAAEQCGILSVPELCEPVKLDSLLNDWPLGRKLVFCDELADQGDSLERLASLRGNPIALLIGPEGGFSSEERALLNSFTFVTSISLGPRILRADTAAVAAMALVQSVAGDWKSGK